MFNIPGPETQSPLVIVERLRDMRLIDAKLAKLIRDMDQDKGEASFQASDRGREAVGVGPAPIPR